VDRLRAAQPERKIAVEAEDPTRPSACRGRGGFRAARQAGAGTGVAEVVRGIAGLPRRPMISAAGGIHEGNARALRRRGGSAGHSAAYAAPPADVSVTVVAETK